MARTKKRYGGTPPERTPKPGEGYVWDSQKGRWVKKPKKQRGYGQASEGRTRKAHGGSVASRLSKAGPVANPN